MRYANQMIILFVAILIFSVSTKAQEVLTLNLRDIHGRKFTLSDYKGKVVLLNFWATWCPPCLAEMPDLVNWQRKYRNRDLQVVGVTYPPTSLSETRKFVGRMKVNYPIVLGTKQTKALFAKGETLPITIVIDRNQKLVETIEGILLPEEFEQKIEPLLRQLSPVTIHRRTLQKTSRLSFTLDNSLPKKYGSNSMIRKSLLRRFDEVINSTGFKVLEDYRSFLPLVELINCLHQKLTHQRFRAP